MSQQNMLTMHLKERAKNNKLKMWTMQKRVEGVCLFSHLHHLAQVCNCIKCVRVSFRFIFGFLQPMNELLLAHISLGCSHSSKPMKAVKCPTSFPFSWRDGRKNSGKAAKVICQDGGLQGGLPIGVTSNRVTWGKVLI